MSKIKTLKKLWKNDKYDLIIALYDNLVHTGLLNYISDRVFLKLTYRIKMRSKLDLDNPQTYNEKLQWLKLYDRNPNYVNLVDKYKVREYVKKIIGEEYLVPLLGKWDNATKIDFSLLPEKFVLKCNHDSGSVIICKNKNNFNTEDASKKLSKCLKKNLFFWCREWPYKNVQPCIIAEKYMVDTSISDLRDFKFFCFDGEPKAMFIAEDRQRSEEETKFDFFDMDFKHLNFTNGHPNAKTYPEKPINFDLMKELAKRLSAGIPHVRVDFYEVDGHVYFGEMTFSHWSGMVPFNPEKWDYIFGSWIKIPMANAMNYNK
ncbi:ATP-grasp fold amidoligase family protein [Eubacterium limosum]|uniref:ATP-grasp fold amidoligase family protein n=1 Tax=Eubacterium limosum TaxID=1736 RepID=UPI0010642BD7|nr:ATP-grasp fold amidoligase family protein [Eubacterium limosum]